MRSCIQRLDDHFRQNAIDWYARFLCVEQQFAVHNPTYVKLDCIANPQARIAQHENECSKPLGVANTRALAVGSEGSKNADHFFSSKRHGGFVWNFRSFQFSRRVIVNPLSLFSEAHERPEPFQLLETCART